MFYDKFRELCEQRQVSVSRAAMDIGLSNSTPTKWKKTGAIPDSSTLAKIAVYFGVSVAYLLGEATTTDGVFFSDGTGYGGGFGSGSGSGYGIGYGGPILMSESSYDKAMELCTFHKLNFSALCDEAGLDETALAKWKAGETPSREKMKVFAYRFLLPVDFFFEQEEETPTAESDGRTVIENPDIRLIARAGQKMTPAQAENLRKYAQYMFPEAFEDDE